MRTDWLNGYGQVEDSTIAESMANIEKPFRETPVTGFKKLFTSKARQIIKWEKLGEEYLDNMVNTPTYQRKIKEKEEERIKEEKRLKKLEKEKEKREAEEKWAKENPEDAIKIAKYKEYLETTPTFEEALELVKRFAIIANNERSNCAYQTYKKSRRLFYEFFIKNRLRTDKYIEQLLVMPSDWKSTEDDEYFLEKLREYDKNTDIYWGYWYISIYRIWNKFHLYSDSGIMNKSLAVRMIIDYANHSGYTNMSECWTEWFILSTLWTSLLNWDKDWWLIPCTPLDELENTDAVFDSHNGTKYHDLISELKRIQNIDFGMDKTQYQQYKNTIFFKKVKEEFEKIAKQEEDKKEQKRQQELEEVRLQKQKDLKKELLS